MKPRLLRRARGNPVRGPSTAFFLSDGGNWPARLTDADDTTAFALPAAPGRGAFFAITCPPEPADGGAVPDADLVVSCATAGMQAVHRALGRADGDGKRPALHDLELVEQVNLPYLAERATLVCGTVGESTLVAAGWRRGGRLVCAYGTAPRGAGDLEPEFLTLLAKLRLRPRKRSRWR
jgi:hypothetical protein